MHRRYGAGQKRGPTKIKAHWSAEKKVRPNAN